MTSQKEIDYEGNIAHCLEGRTLESGWKVLKKIKKTQGQSGAIFSVSYIVEKDDKKCFLKAFNLAAFIAISGSNPDGTQKSRMDIMYEMSSMFKYEKKLSEHCKKNNANKVSYVKDFGEENIAGYTDPYLAYLIFDLAEEGDIRRNIDFSRKLDYSWSLRSLHDVAVGLRQLHNINISHQDLKPSNILVFNKESKICDLGRSILMGEDGPFSKWNFSGDQTYSPPEIKYGYYEQSDQYKRSFATDCYMLGSLLSFYFTGAPFFSIMMLHIPSELQWDKWTDSYDKVIPVLESAFAKALKSFEDNIVEEEFKKELTSLLSHLCDPCPNKRGHPKNIISKSHLQIPTKVTNLIFCS